MCCSNTSAYKIRIFIKSQSNTKISKKEYSNTSERDSMKKRLTKVERSKINIEHPLAGRSPGDSDRSFIR